LVWDHSGGASNESYEKEIERSVSLPSFPGFS
jgi:hypothetical protein